MVLIPGREPGRRQAVCAPVHGPDRRQSRQGQKGGRPAPATLDTALTTGSQGPTLHGRARGSVPQGAHWLHGDKARWGLTAPCQCLVE